MDIATTVVSPKYRMETKIIHNRRARAGTTLSHALDGELCFQTYFVHIARSRFVRNFRTMAWSIRSSLDGNGFDPSPPSSTRLIKAIQRFQTTLTLKIQRLKKDLPMKLFFFLAGFYCATAFSTVIGQTGDWDVLSAALAVVVVEAIGALMYRASFPFLDRIRSLIAMSNYWKAGLALGLFLDSFKY